MKNATAEANSPNTNRASIAWRTESLLNLKFIEEAVEQSLIRLDSGAMHAVLETEPQCVESLRLQKFGQVNIVDRSDIHYWRKNEELYNDMKTTMKNLLDERVRPPPVHCKINKIKKIFNMDPPLHSQATAVSYLNSEIMARVVCADVDRTYIQIQGDSIARLEEMKYCLQSYAVDQPPPPVERFGNYLIFFFNYYFTFHF